eukprot:73008-Rhodomonas_salina.1
MVSAGYWYPGTRVLGNRKDHNVGHTRDTDFACYGEGDSEPTSTTSSTTSSTRSIARTSKKYYQQ